MAYSPIEQAYVDGIVSAQFPTPEHEPQAEQQVMLADSGQVKSDAPQDFGSIGPIKRNKAQEALGYVGEMLSKAGVELDKIGLDVPMLGRITLKDLTVGDAGKVIEDMSYGFMPVEGAGGFISGTTRIKPDAALELMNVIPAAGAIAKAGGKGAVKAGKALAPKAGEMAEDFLRKQGAIADIVPPGPKMSAVKPGDELIVQHNLTAKNLVKADQLGGLPVPSLAISKASNPLQNFGEITLIGGKDMANPSAKNPVFSADGYTKRFPSIDYQIDHKVEKSLKAALSDVVAKMPDGEKEFNRLIGDWNNREYSDLLKVKYLDEIGQLPTTKDAYEFGKAVRQTVYDNQSDFDNWMMKFDESLPDMGVNIKERIFKGYTYSGNRMYREVNLNNLVKEMKGGAGSEGFNYGVGSMRAAATPKFRTFSQIKASRDKVVDADTMKQIKEETDKNYVSLLVRLGEIGNYDASDALLEIAETRNITALDRIYGADKVPKELKADIGLFVQTLRNLPTEYFEIKPQRAVNIGEFKGAIIPADTPKKARDALQKNGITEIYEYKTPEERTALFQKYGKEMFSVAPAIPAAQQLNEEKK